MEDFAESNYDEWDGKLYEAGIRLELERGNGNWQMKPNQYRLEILVNFTSAYQSLNSSPSDHWNTFFR